MLRRECGEARRGGAETASATFLQLDEGNARNLLIHCCCDRSSWTAIPDTAPHSHDEYTPRCCAIERHAQSKACYMAGEPQSPRLKEQRKQVLRVAHSDPHCSAHLHHRDTFQVIPRRPLSRSLMMPYLTASMLISRGHRAGMRPLLPMDKQQRREAFPLFDF